MRNGYNQQHQRQQQQLYHHLRTSSSFFLPMLCKISIKDVKLHKKLTDPDGVAEPSSPKVSCMGQVKIRNNKVIGFPPPYKPTNSTAIAGPVTSYTKLKKLFSGKNFTASNSNKELKRSVTVGAGDLRKSNTTTDLEISKNHEVNVSELDPPLPVVKKVKPPSVDTDGGLWKRRSGGVALTALQIQRIHLSTDNNSMQPTTV